MTWPKILKHPLNKKEIKELTKLFFEDMIKLVVDIEKGKLAAGCSLHADAEHLFLKHGSKQENLWGANYFPNRKSGERLEFSALMNIRPRQNNPGQLIRSAHTKKLVEEISGDYIDL